MACAHPFVRYDRKLNQSYTCPCGWCIPCRISKRKHWESRLMMEQATSTLAGSTGLFCTFTYSDKFLPKAGVSHRDVRNFIKLLRERSYRKECARAYLSNPDLRKEYSSITKFERSRTIERPRISFFLASEYGGKLGRAHYHAIIFIQPRYSRYVKECWRNGFSEVKPLRNGGVRYVLKYLDKQQSHVGDDLYRKAGLEPPFTVKSRGLGLDFIKSHLDEIREYGGIRMKGKIVPVSRHYADKYDIDTANIFVRFVPMSEKLRRARMSEKSEMCKMRNNLTPFFDYYTDSRFAYSTLVDDWHFATHRDLTNQIIKEIDL